MIHSINLNACDEYAHCPICGLRIDQPVWLPKKFTAYCPKCERGYTTKEIRWDKRKGNIKP